MALSVAAINFVIPDTTPLNVFTAGAGQQYVIVKASLTNTDGAGHTVTLYRVQDGGMPDATSIFGADGLAVAPAATSVLPISGQGLVDGQMLQAVADTGAFVNLSITFARIA